jgi:serine/threonine-protein kinase RsbW
MAISPSNKTTITIKNDAKLANGVCEDILALAKKSLFTEDDLFGIHLSLEEAIVNAVRHGNGGDPNKKVVINYLVNDNAVDVRIADQGTGFKPETVPDCRSPENILKLGGRGLLLMKNYMDVVEYNDRGNEVHLVKYKKKSIE